MQNSISADHIDNSNTVSETEAYEPPSFQDMGSFRAETGAFAAAPIEPGTTHGIK